jgi:hypothetical protein
MLIQSIWIMLPGVIQECFLDVLIHFKQITSTHLMNYVLEKKKKKLVHVSYRSNAHVHSRLQALISMVIYSITKGS